MEREKIHFYIIASVILIIIGIDSIVYSTIIPVRNYPNNAFASSIFLIGGVVLIIVGILFILVIKQRFLFQKINVGEENGK